MNKIFEGQSTACQFASNYTRDNKGEELIVIISRNGGVHYIVRKKGAKLNVEGEERILHTYKNGQLA